MAFRLDIGQYYAADSPIHALDARVKLCSALVLMVAIFCATTPAQLAVSTAAVAFVLSCSHVGAGRIVASVRPLVMVLAVLSAFNLFFVQTGGTLVALGAIRITVDGAWAAVLYTVRFALAVLVGSLILITTTPTRLSDALDRLFSPFARVGLPGHEIAMVIALMLRFVPVLADEASAIIDAQSMRGGGFDEGGVIARVRAIVPVVVALFASGLRHAEGLSRALDARCYEGGPGRTHFREPHLGARDALAAFFSLAFVVAIVLLA